MSVRKQLKILFIVVVLVLSGCCRTYEVNVDSLSVDNIKQKNKYVLLPGRTSVSSSDLQFIEFAAYTDNALQLAGFEKAKNADEADVAILLDYGLGANPYNFTYTLPIYGQNGISSATTYGTMNAFGNTATYSGQTNYTPSYGVIGVTTRTCTGVSFTRYLNLVCFDLEKFRVTKDDKDAQNIWTTRICSTGTNGDLREVFPILLAASQGYIATNTGKSVQVYLTEQDRRVRMIKTLQAKKNQG